LTSLHDDIVGGDSDADGDLTPPGPQQWGWIQFEDASDDSKSAITYATIRYGGLERFGCCDDSTGAAIRLFSAAPLLDHNLIASNYRGIDTFDTIQPQLGCNDIVGNQSFGFYNNKPQTVIGAPNQWWGSALGPKHTSNSTGNGSLVTSGVQFTPWATQPCRQTVLQLDIHVFLPLVVR
jgi:hypothetical protein